MESSASTLSESLTPTHANSVVVSSGDKARRQLVLAMVFCFLFMIGEVVGGVVSGSLAILTECVVLERGEGGLHACHPAIHQLAFPSSSVGPLASSFAPHLLASPS